MAASGTRRSRAHHRVLAAGLHVVFAVAGNRLRPMRPVASLTCTAAAEGRGGVPTARRSVALYGTVSRKASRYFHFVFFPACERPRSCAKVSVWRPA